MRALPHTGSWGLFHAVWTRCSGPFQHAQGGGCCPHRYTGASASESHKLDLDTHTQTHKLLTFLSISLTNYMWHVNIMQQQIMAFIDIFPPDSSPVVKRSWTSAAGLDSDREGMEEAWGGREVEAGEDRVRDRGWWDHIGKGKLRESRWEPGLRITCRCGSQRTGNTINWSSTWQRLTWINSTHTPKSSLSLH